MISELLLTTLLSFSSAYPYRIEEPTRQISTSYVYSHFNKLEYNFGNNFSIYPWENNQTLGYQSGLCGYVAMASYLCFLDTYRNDNIVSSTYIETTNATNLTAIKSSNGSAKSPGNINTSYVYTYWNQNYSLLYNSNCFYQAFTNINLNTHLDEDLMAQLTILGNNLDLYEQGLNNCYTSVPTLFQLKDGDVGTILTSYFSTFCPTVSYTLSSKTRSDSLSDKINFIKTNIDNYKPVIVGLENGIYSSFDDEYNIGHMVIIYDYTVNSSTGVTTFYCHTGWHGNATMQFTTDYANNGYSVGNLPTYIVEAYSVNVSTHVHSSNLKINNVGICPCQFDICHSSHTHDYSYDIVSYGNRLFHKVFCMCGAYASEFHEWEGNECIYCHQTK